MFTAIRDLQRRLTSSLETPEAEPTRVSRTRRVAIAVAVGLMSSTLAYAYMTRSGYYADFLSPWFGARALLAGINPYMVAPSEPPYNIDDPLFYPLPSVALLLPLAGLPVAVAGAVFVGFSAGLLAYGVTRTGYHRLPLFLSAPFMMAASLGQWAPLITAAALLPAWRFLVLFKPNLGLPIFVYRPSWRAVVVCSALVALSVAVAPWWPAAWLHNVQGGRGKQIPLLAAGGFLLLLALLRWRRSAARLLLALACVPQVFLFADQLPLWLLPTTFRQSLVVTILSQVGLLAWISSARAGDELFTTGVPYVLGCVYLPFLALVLLQRPAPPVGTTGADETAPDAPQKAG